MLSQSVVSSPPPVFAIDVHPDRERAVVIPRGELDIATAEPLEREVLDLCALGFDAICLDLREVSFFDSSGLRLLVRLDDALRAAGCSFTLVGGDGAAARVLRLTRMDRRFTFARSPLDVARGLRR